MFLSFVDSPYRDEISKTILRMQENSELELLKDKWWKGAICGGSTGQDANSELGMSNVGGVFVVLLAGIAVAFIITAVEFFWKVAKLSKATKVLSTVTSTTFTEKMFNLFSFCFDCRDRFARKWLARSCMHLSYMVLSLGTEEKVDNFVSNRRELNSLQKR